MKLMSLTKAALLVAAIPFGTVFAQTASKSVDVTVTLSSQCRVASTSSGVVTLAFGTYTAFSATAVTAPTQTINFECTRGLTNTPQFAWDGATPSGTIAGLRYELSAATGTATAGTEPVLGTAGDIGTPSSRPITVSGSMPSGQAGTNGATASETRTLTVTF